MLRLRRAGSEPSDLQRDTFAVAFGAQFEPGAEAETGFEPAYTALQAAA